MNPTLPMLLIGFLALIGLLLFLFNVRQAVSGFRQMKRIDRDICASKSQQQAMQLLSDELDRLRQRFDRKVESFGIAPEERNKIWKPVDEAMVRSINALLVSNVTTAESELRTAIAAARQILADFNDEDCGCT